MDFESNNNNKLFNVVKKFKPRIIINCAAMSELDKCRVDPKKAYEIKKVLEQKSFSLRSRRSRGGGGQTANKTFYSFTLIRTLT